MRSHLNTPPPGKRAPLLSLIFNARNDNYMGDFKWRIATACNYMARGLTAIGRLGDVEIVVGDWNSDVPLHKELVLSPEAQSMTRFVVVPAQYAIPIQKESKFPNCIVYNTSIRRAWGEYIALANSDVLFPPSTLLLLLLILEGKIPGVPVRESLMTAARGQIPVSQVTKTPPLLELEEYVNRNLGLFPTDSQHVGTAAPAELMMLHRDIWHDCGANDERFIHWGWMDVDLALRITQKYPLVHLNNYGVRLLHLEHYTEQRNYDPKTFHRKVNKSDDTPRFRVNDENWGLGDKPLEWFYAEKTASIEAVVTPPPGAVEVWNATLPQIANGFGDQGVEELLRTALGQNGGLVQPHEVNAYRALAWYSLSRRPRSFVDVNMRYPMASALVARASPGVEIYGIVDWERNRADEAMFADRDDACFTFLASNTLRGLGHWAYTRFIGDDPATAIERLAHSSLGTFRIEVALLRADAPHAVGQAMQLLNYLRPGGALVVTASRPASFQAVVDAVRARFPHLALINFEDRLNGIFLAMKPAA